MSKDGNDEDAGDDTSNAKNSTKGSITCIEFKDENSRVIARLNPQLAHSIRLDLRHVVQGLTKASCSFVNPAKKEENTHRACQLQKKMRKGIHTAMDFHDNVPALWIYTKRKFSSRAITTFELLRSAQESLRRTMPMVTSATSSLLEESVRKQRGQQQRPFHFPSCSNTIACTTTVLSIGGGPGNDLFGYLLFEKYGSQFGNSDITASSIDTAMETWQPTSHNINNKPIRSRLGVFDFASDWRPIVECVSRLSQEEISFHTCDLAAPLTLETNASVVSFTQPQYQLHNSDNLRSTPPRNTNDSSHRVTIYLFVYVLSEVMGPAGDPPALLIDLLERAAAAANTEKDGGMSIFLFREPHGQALRTLLSYYSGWKEGTDFWRLSFGGLMVVFGGDAAKHHCFLPTTDCP